MNEHAVLSREEIAEMVANHSRAHDVYMQGRLDGYAAGYAAAQLQQEEWADLLVRRQRALEYLDTEARKVAVSAAEWVDVLAFRKSPESSYVPARGDSRYREAAA